MTRKTPSSRLPLSASFGTLVGGEHQEVPEKRTLFKNLNANSFMNVNTKRSLKREHYLRSEHKYQNVNTRKSLKTGYYRTQNAPISKHHNVPKENNFWSEKKHFYELRKIDIHSGPNKELFICTATIILITKIVFV